MMHGQKNFKLMTLYWNTRGTERKYFSENGCTKENVQ